MHYLLLGCTDSKERVAERQFRMESTEERNGQHHFKSF